jgi:nucleoside-diphosphate-sugar epimerase
MRVGDGTNRVDVTYIDNAAAAHLQAAAALGPGGRCNGRAYFLSQGEPVSLWPFVGEILERADAPPVRGAMSFRSAYRIGSAMEMAYRMLRKTSEPRMTRFLACQLATDHYFDTSRAREDFGYEPAVSTAEGLGRLFAEPPQA